eukprot:3451994-Pyramimonas_sp.AAC.2
MVNGQWSMVNGQCVGDTGHQGNKDSQTLASYSCDLDAVGSASRSTNIMSTIGKENTSMNSNSGGVGVNGHTSSEQSPGKLPVEETKQGVVARRYALKFSPPSVVLEYRQASKSRLRTVRC